MSRDVRLPLAGLQLAAFVTLLRSVALDRWITVAVSVALLVAVHTMQRGRTWGVALSFTLGIALAGMVAFGLAPLWLAVVGLLAMLPFVRSFRLFAGFDRGAAALLGGIAVAAGGLGAMAWKQYAMALFQTFPMLSPSLYPHHGLAVLALLTGGLAGRRLQRSANESPRVQATDAEVEPSRVRIDAFDTNDTSLAASYEELEAEAHSSASVTTKA